MSLLAPLYFAGALAIGLPILFHLIRRRPKGEVEFSSLMFLQPTPPRLTRKSRLDNWPLLLIRALALLLLAAAFTRPFLRTAALSDSDVPARRMVLVVDTSASMQRAGLWQQALDHAEEVIDDLQAADQIALVTFDQAPRTLLGFEQSAELALPQRKASVKRLLKETTPTWLATETGKAISFAADLATAHTPPQSEDAPEDAVKLGGGPAHMILITDMQAGSQLESLQVFEWPEKMRLDIKKVVPKERTNASAQLLSERIKTEGEDETKVRVRISNAADSTDSRFRLRWANASGEASSQAAELPVQVPPGQSRVIRMPSPTPGIDSLVLSGDDHSFDNVRYLVSPKQRELKLLYLGSVSGQPRESLVYYLQRVPWNNSQRIVTVESAEPNQLTQTPDPVKTPLIVVATPLSSDVTERLREYIDRGGRVLYVLTSAGKVSDHAISIGSLTQVERDDADPDAPQAKPLVIAEAEIDDYVMFSRIDFGHPVFATMADPQFNDFTKIRIWSHRQIKDLDSSWNVLCHFDDGDPALIEWTVDEQRDGGRLWVLGTGWQPSESQLALSTKFVPLIFRLFDTTDSQDQSTSFAVGESINHSPSDLATITRPSGAAFEFQTDADASQIDQPGIYTFNEGDLASSFAVNLAASESQTETIADTDFERFGITLGAQETTQQTQARQRQLRDIELEKRQRLWQWLLVAALALLALETLLGGVISRSGNEASDTTPEPAPGPQT